ncbi:MAG: LamG domain-containing protein [Romboutsia timonensis]
MGLIAWYPLNGNYRNYGLDGEDLTAVGSLSFDSGKIGKALTFTTANTANRLIRSQFQQTSNLTICAWIKPSAYTDKYRYIFTQGRADVNSDGFGLAFISNDNKLSFRFGNLNWTYTFTPDEWIHFVFTIDENKEANMYIDGEKVANGTVGTLPDYSEGNGNFTIGCFAYVSGYLYPATGAINDFRFYDEVLSVKQIKEIAKGLVVHYPLNSGYGNENLLVEGNKLSSWTQENCTATQESDENFSSFIKITSTTTNQRIYRGVNNVWTTVSEIFTVSFYAKTETDGMTIDLSRSISDFTNKFSLTSEWKRYVGHIKVTSSSNAGTLSVRLNIAGTVCIADVKLERGEIDTFYVPNEADDLYSILGYDSTTIYDASGYENNAEKINTPIYISDTPLYDSCIDFNQSGYLKNTFLDLYVNELTVCFWVKIPDTITAQHFLFSTHNDWTNNGIGMWRDNSTQKGYYLIIKSNAESTFSRPFIGIDVVNTWTFIAISYTGQQYSVYKNGSLYQTVDYGSNGQVYNPVLYLGNSLYNGTPSTETDEASMSDFRVYSTALSAEDIKQLYESRARIDKNGNVYCSQFIDNDYEEELLTSQKMGLSQANAQAAISYETNGSQIINIITFEDTLSSWRYLWNSSFDKTKILNSKLRLSFKYKLDSDEQIQGNVAMMKGNATGSQTISKNTIYFNKQWQEYNGVITFGDTYDSQEIYIAINNTDFAGKTIYIKDLSLKIFNERDNVNMTKQSQIVSSEITELESGKTSINKNNKLIVNEIIEI